MSRAVSDRPLLARVVDWLRAGYPQGVPPQDYVALLGVLHRQLTQAEIVAIVERLRADRAGGDVGDVGDEEISALIARTALERPSESDIRRVAAHLAAGGWPLAELGGPAAEETDEPQGQPQAPGPAAS